MKYQLISAIFASSLEPQVNKLLSKGWELFGPPFAKNDMLYQAMIKKDSIKYHD